MKIKARQNTFLKKSTNQALTLIDSGDRIPVTQGKEYEVESVGVLQDSHVKVILSSGQGSWYIFQPHWDILNSKPQENFDKVVWSDFKSQVSQFFTVGEVCNYDKTRVPYPDLVKRNVLQLAAKLDLVRESWGQPIIVTSWYRPYAVNKAVGGVRNSQHLNGGAVDIKPLRPEDGLKFESWLDKEAWANNALGYGQKSGRGFTHLDLRPGKIRWNY